MGDWTNQTALAGKMNDVEEASAIVRAIVRAVVRAMQDDEYKESGAAA